MPRTKKSHRRDPSPSHSHSSDSSHTASANDMALSGIATSAWFPFFILAFASLGSFFTVVAWTFPFVQAGDYRFVPLLLAGIGGMILSPMIGLLLSNMVLEATDCVGRWLLHPLPPTQEKEDAGVARGLVLVLVVLLGVVAYLVVVVRNLGAETATLRREIAYVALRDAQAHEKGWF
ncbi:uncharacterized protein CcaverHIS019_0703420 [Cutaneotrichosporon cavernicola]|uniref:Uncharacterized protein n=1 Tax=Cutaneotrichosporon cavernicola TaxID=279322 RepID=A0AA48L9P4_9TREE|nr:uncharacterized protein CcaverHIS019_0703420 [Cutaneotrichosporon cavernicola]BEI94761.1 hypothetical protein CcaverHIS019_0703420 [Cutaneotrichosporon cavernicola]BEJ10294.1 hypothetical protein CcaverHIS641_0703290 [Cutaneotrichosporon cavernicola]